MFVADDVRGLNTVDAVISKLRNMIRMAESRNLRLREDMRWSVYFASIALPTIFLATIILQPWFEASWMFMDVLTAARESEVCCHATFGLVSQVGLLMWGATAAIALFAALLLHAARHPPAEWRFMLFAGLFTGWLVLDDAFLLHESILPGIGIPQTIVLSAYIILAAVYLLASHHLIRASEWILLFGAGVAIAASVGLDIFMDTREAWAVIVEDAFKFLGFALWASYHIVTAALLILRSGQTALEFRGD